MTKEMGMRTTKFHTPRIRNVAEAPQRSIKACVTGAKTSPPAPEPERAMPIAKPRCLSKNGGVNDVIG
jgi:hypothetical protein